MTTTLEERIDAAAKAICQIMGIDPDADAFPSDSPMRFDGPKWRWFVETGYAEEVAKAFAPELFTDPPGAWLAPWEATDEVALAERPLFETTRDVWRRLRDAHLSPTPPKPMNAETE